MRFAAVAVDYDGTLATDGVVQPATLDALERCAASGRKLILVTGRILRDLLAILPAERMWSRIVAENGAVLYRPATRERLVLGDPVPSRLVEALQRKSVRPLQTGESIIETVKPHEVSVLEAIRDLGLEHHVIFNRESVMVLPPGVTKASGLKAALHDLQLSPHNTVGIGDSENDHALFQSSELSVAVNNAISTLREAADVVTDEADGAGVAQVLTSLVTDDLAQAARRLDRHRISLGSTAHGAPVSITPAGDNLLIAGSSASGKSTLAHGILEQLTERGYQVCVVDPEGDYESFDNAIAFGNAKRGPTLSEILTAVENPDAQIVVNLVGLPLQDRPPFFLELLPRLQEYRAKTGRPHRIVVDETHHLMPSTWRPAPEVSTDLAGMVFVTVHPEQVSSVALHMVDLAVALGERPADTLKAYAECVGIPFPLFKPATLEAGEALAWRVRERLLRPEKFRIQTSKTERHRHRRKYAEGELPPDRSFYFRGPTGQLNLRAHNLIMFRQLADGVDDATWLYHLRNNDYSRWMETAIKDPFLAALVRHVESESSLSADVSRRYVTKAIEQRYTLPVVGS
ncbi:MAG TPA: HAD hydrolase family protein [Nitrospira sp.]|nr:HAD hydrolase family protein [Nitrospira sp.]